MKENQIKSFEVSNLFGYYNHKIDFFDGGITIIIGENGIGKTYLLNMIHKFFSLEWGYFLGIIFDEMKFTFQDNKILRIYIEDDRFRLRLYVSEEKYLTDLQNSYDNSTSDKKYDLELEFLNRNSRLSMENHNTVAKKLSEVLPNIDRVNHLLYIDKNTGRKYSRRELVEEFADNLINIIVYQKIDNSPDWLQVLIDSNKTDLIEAQRLYQFREDDYSAIETIMQLSYQLRSEFSKKDREYNLISVELDSKFVFELVNRIKNEHRTEDDLSDKFQQLNKKRAELEEIGLFDSRSDRATETVSPEDVATSKDAISLYIENTNKKLNVYNSLYEKMKLFRRLINKRFKRKKVRFNKETGFEIVALHDEVEESIPLSTLSSGEKNEFILYFNLIFENKANSIILIDEPEISLHIKWQEYFLSDLQEILKESKVRILIATHSPDIIGSNWEIVNDLVVEG
ncbi:TPA: AAA family ATPase [Streptococcus suis]